MTEWDVQQSLTAEPDIRKPRRWRWLVGFVVIFLVGAGVGAGIAGNQLPADDNPTVQARLTELAQLRNTAKERTADTEQELAERAEQLDAREQQIEQDAAALDAREADHDRRGKLLDKRESGLKKRENSLRAEERRIAANTVAGDGVFVVGEDIKAGTYKTTGPAAGGIGSCYYAFKSGTGADADIIDNNLVQGPATVTVRAGQIFETTSCSKWKRQ
ncbi:MAG: hypothetical protein GEU97_02310 [Actinophytocola sp.]|nr:hypothetical protein [Actinophytocola sp.]